LAALYVCLHHVFGFPYGRFAVDVFIVISGYCLMLPVYATGQLPGGLLAFAKRRCRRIIPTYYAALCLALLLPHSVSGASIVTHFLLIHNLWPSLIYTLNGPAWSLATEWQIYFVFALLLVPVWNRYGNGVMLLTATAVAFVPYCFNHQFDLACPDFVLLFAFGMVTTTLKGRGVWGIVVLICSATVVGLLCDRPQQWIQDHQQLIDIPVGAATCAAILLCRQYDTVRKTFSIRPLIFLGSFSYSLYIVHFPLVQYLKDHEPVVLILPTVLICCYLFYLIFERPFLKPATSRPVAPEPAP